GSCGRGERLRLPGRRDNTGISVKSLAASYFAGKGLPGAEEQDFDMSSGFAEYLRNLADIHFFSIAQPKRLELDFGKMAASQSPQISPVFASRKQFRGIVVVHSFR